MKMMNGVVMVQYRVKSNGGLSFAEEGRSVSDLLGLAFDFMKPLDLNEWLSRNIWGLYKWNQTGANSCRTDLSMCDLFRYQKITWCELIDEERGLEMWDMVVEFFNEIAPFGYYFGSRDGMYGWFQIKKERV